MNALTRPVAQVAPLSVAIVKQIAMDIGKEVASHIETMYPDAVKATSKNMLLSVRGCVYNEIIAAIQTTDEDAIAARLEERKRMRRRNRAVWRAEHPDAELLALCAKLAEMQAEWQRLWALCPSDSRQCPENDALADYSEDVWPGIGLVDFGGRPRGDLVDVPKRLLSLHPTTLEGLQAKAAAVLAMYDAASYSDCRNDACDFTRSLLLDAAGPDYQVPGDGKAA